MAVRGPAPESSFFAVLLSDDLWLPSVVVAGRAKCPEMLIFALLGLHHHDSAPSGRLNASGCRNVAFPLDLESWSSTLCPGLVSDPRVPCSKVPFAALRTPFNTKAHISLHITVVRKMVLKHVPSASSST